MNSFRTIEQVNSLFRRSIEAYGAIPQLRMVQEEAGELITAINHFLRGREGGQQSMVEEVADCLIMLHQARILAGPEKVDQVVREKLARLSERTEKMEQRKETPGCRTRGADAW